MASDPPSEGDVVAYARTFTEEDVRAFAELSEDRGDHHLERDAEGRLLVHGLLTATLPTKVGGDMNFLARSMEFDFRRPVYTGEEITCRVTIERLDEREDRYVGVAAVACENESGETVMTGSFDGIVRK
ncbi:MaoC family dehydratase N-terminal domain-containing protein [Halobium palmae]|uniref:MaoC family dehydratase N-terminal domain-containing protein n=1 Tax=Halobium palmae TaxID=1776492 RepID=A0ABD5RYC6_9EURY